MAPDTRGAVRVQQGVPQQKDGTTEPHSPTEIWKERKYTYNESRIVFSLCKNLLMRMFIRVKQKWSVAAALLQGFMLRH